MAKVIQLFLMVQDLETSREFYESVLHCAPERIGETSATYRTGECHLKIQQDFPDQTLSEYNMTPPPETNRGAGSVYVLTCDSSLSSVEQKARTFFEDHRGEVLREPQPVPWSDEPMMLLQDPDGYILEIRGS